MKPSKKKLITTSLITFALSVNQSSAFDIVNDPMHMAQTVIGFAKEHADAVRQLNTLTSQLQQLQQTYQMVTSTYNSMTGNRGYGGVLPLTNQVRNYLPTSAGDMLDVINGVSSTYSNMSDMVQNYTHQNAILSPDNITDLNMNENQLKLLTQRRNNIAAIQAAATQNIDAASQRFGYIQQLIDHINNTNDPKAVAELQARIAGEQVMLQNDQSKMQQMYAYLQNQELMTQQQLRELSIQQTGNAESLQRPDLSVISYGN